MQEIARRQTCPCYMPDRKSTRLNSSHVSISYAVFCLKKKRPWMHDGAFTTLEATVRHHLDPAASLRSYAGRDLDAQLKPTLVRSTQPLKTLDPLVIRP